MRVDARGLTHGEVLPPNTLRGGASGTKFRPMVDGSPAARARIQKAMPTAADHHTALQNLAERLSLPVSLPGSNLKPLQSLRDRQTRLRAASDRRQQEEIFEESRKFLMGSTKWTFGHMAAYQRKLLDLMGAYGWRRRLSQDDPSIAYLEKELKVLEAMTPVELASNHKRVFTKDAVRLIAEKSGATEKFVNQVIMEHDILRADRRWYMILEQFRKPLPKSFEDRQHMAEYDRPFSQTEREMRDEMMEEHERKSKGKRPPRITKIYYRHPTVGGNRWSSRPPRWYPSRWSLRPERKRRLEGVGVGRGGDRGRPWGNLRDHAGL